MTTHPSVQQFTATANASLQTFQSLADTILNASEQLLSLNVEAARSLCAHASAQTLPLDGEEFRSRFTNSINVNNEGFEQATEYLRNVNEICLRTQTEFAEISTRHFNEISSSMQSLFNEVSKLTPASTLETFVTPTANARNSTRKAA
ncbi:phasin family protein [Thauera sp.]|uniref:phasin family protein n=1 Tax=Thauera sp. TaxID=1905334 RepID=UPI0039E53506